MNGTTLSSPSTSSQRSDSSLPLLRVAASQTTDTMGKNRLFEVLSEMVSYALRTQWEFKYNLFSQSHWKILFSGSALWLLLCFSVCCSLLKHDRIVSRNTTSCYTDAKLNRSTVFRWWWAVQPVPRCIWFGGSDGTAKQHFSPQPRYRTLNSMGQPFPAFFCYHDISFDNVSKSVDTYIYMINSDLRNVSNLCLWLIYNYQHTTWVIISIQGQILYIHTFTSF